MIIQKMIIPIADWKFFAVKILNVQKIIYNCSIGYSKVHYDIFSPELKRSLAKIVNLDFSLYLIKIYIHFLISFVAFYIFSESFF